MTTEKIYALPVDAEGWRTLPNGSRVHLGHGVHIGDGVHIGARAKIGARATDAIDLGDYEGYRKMLAQVDGTAYIGAGCRWFTLREAREHWTGRADRPISLAMLDFAEAIAKARGWKLG